ncbi:hypothetical protein BRADI_5g10342v3 [Brachypodium distachyon]|uniref:F-box associated domain-containing protein n=1 Tax=Brachypodium distachyon TaxID=15368 RepID=A0A0Q3I975_BRADI|nr:hypothetical protein BRADI_5g10342v3 [Brachypodium distachyon]
MARGRKFQGISFTSILEDIQQEILARLMAKSVFRCRIVWWAWHRLTSGSRFFLEHHLHQPEFPLVATSSNDTDLGISLGVVDFCVSGIHPLATPPIGYNCQCSIEASCNGLVIIGGYIGNPSTRQWAPFAAHVDSIVVLFLAHQLSSEYRVLFWRYKGVSRPPSPIEVHCPIEYFVLTVGCKNPRVVKCLLMPKMPKIEYELIVFIQNRLFLHWRNRAESICYHKILVFDTLAETFRHTKTPGVKTCDQMQLFDMERVLAAYSSTYRMTGMRIFIMRGHYERHNTFWVFHHRIKLLKFDIRRFQEQGDWWAKIVSKDCDLLVSCFGMLLHFDKSGKLAGKFKYDDDVPVILGQKLKYSLIEHRFVLGH